MFVCTKFRAIRSRDFGFRTRKPPRKFGVKSGLNQKRLKYGKKYLKWLYVLIYPFIPTNPRFAALRLISFLFLSFSSKYLYVLLLLNHKTSKSNFCMKLLNCKRNFFSRNFLGQLHREPPQIGAPKNQFFERLKLEC